MKRGATKGELGRLLQPMATALQALFLRLHWWMALLALAYAGSGLTLVQPDEVAMVLRLGGLVDAGTAQAVHGPGLLVALPRPFDEVVRVRSGKVEQIEVRDLHWDQQGDDQGFTFGNTTTIDPTAQGYLVTGDQNLVHAVLVVRWQVRDPVRYALHQADTQGLIRDAVLAAAVRSAGELSVDQVLTDGRQGLIEQVEARSQARLDALDSGLSIVAVEFTDLSPPRQVKREFSEVQSAFIEAETAVKEAEEYREKQLPRARADGNRGLRDAEGEATALLAEARGDAQAFLSLATEARKDRRVVTERLYRESIEAALSQAEKVEWVPPPPGGGRYTGFRLTVSAKPEKRR
jgi:membrane protease subunit HflK